MLEPKRPLKVFLCHASTDKPKVRELYRYLKRRGIRPWFDEVDLIGGQDWQVEIPKALATSDAIIICLTKNSVDKEGYIQKEIKFALDKALEMPEGRIFLIPVKFEECEIPFSLSRYQWVDLTIESGYAKMMKALKFRASQLERNTVQLPKNEIDEDKLAVEKVFREKAEKETTEKARLEVEEQERQKAAKEKAEHETAEREKAELKAIEKAAKEKEEVEKEDKRRLEKSIKKAKRDLWWEKLKIDIRYLFRVIYIYRVPILILFVTFAIATPIVIRLSNLIPEIITTFNNAPTATVSLTLAPQSIINPTETFIPLETLTPGLISTEVLVATPTSLPTEITDIKGVPMVLVPSGGFMMGDESSDQDDEKPIHKVELSAFYMDIYEVTNAQYKACVVAGVCNAPKLQGHYGDVQFDSYPVIYVDWNQADIYCKWRGTSLPTEAQWEKAARGTNGFSYPWGNEFAPGNVNYCDKSCSSEWADPYNSDGYSNTAPVGSFESGKSPYGIFDMAGNVWEWTADWYSDTYYSELINMNPLGPSSGSSRVTRGGSWATVTFGRNIRSANRSNLKPDKYANDIGFRCVINNP